MNPLLRFSFISIFSISLLLLLQIAFVSEARNIILDDNDDGSISAFVSINKILIEGNRKTKEFVILRELPFQLGDSIEVAALMETLDLSKQHLVNTSLFLTVMVKVHEWEDDQMTILIYVRERLYSLPRPIFKLADRNFNVWWSEFDHDFKRTVYGLDFYQFNFRGRDEILNVMATLGYTQQLFIYYKIPFLDKKQRKGLALQYGMSRNKEVAYAAENNKQNFYIDNDFIEREFYGAAHMLYRKKIYDVHKIGILFNHLELGDTVHVLNEDFIRDRRFNQAYFGLSYIFERKIHDTKSYPLKGYDLRIEVEKLGLGFIKDVNIFSMYAKLSKYISLGRNFYLGGQALGKMSFPKKQSYYNQRSLGFEEQLVRGYELYVIDGRHYSVGKINIKKKLFSFTLNNSKWLKIEQLSRIPFAFYLKLYSDIGYVYDDTFSGTNDLSNKFLIGYGVGIDVTTAYDLNMRVEYSINRLKEKGIFLHFIQDF